MAIDEEGGEMETNQPEKVTYRNMIALDDLFTGEPSSVNRCKRVLKEFVISWLTTAFVMGAAIGHFFAVIQMAKKPDGEGQINAGVIMYIIFVIAFLSLVAFWYTIQFYPRFEAWTTIFVVFTAFLIVECSVAAASSFSRGDVSTTPVSNTTPTPIILEALHRKRTLVINPSDVNTAEFGEYLDLTGSGLRVYRMANITSLVLTTPLIKSPDDRIWLTLIPQDWIVPVNSAIGDLRHRFPNTTLQPQVVAVTGTTAGQRYFTADRQLYATQVSFFVGLCVSGFVMAIIMPIVTLRKSH